MSEARFGTDRCPGCGGALTMLSTSVPDERASEVSVCGACYGVWFDWWAGETAALASDLLQLPRSARGPRGREHTTSVCPRDGAVLELQPYLDRGPSVRRCARCMGVFAARPQIDELAAFSRVMPEPEGPIEDRSVWARLWRLFR